MSAVVVIVGEGNLADCVIAELSESREVIRQADFENGVAEAADLVLVLHDAWYPEIHHAAETILQSSGKRWLRGFAAFGEGVVGPLVQPGTPGCTQCADRRRLMAYRDRREVQKLTQRLAEQGGGASDAWASRTGLLHVARFIATETDTILRSGDTALTVNHMYLVNLQTLESTRHFLMPDSLCPICSRIVDDTPEAARIELQSRPKQNVNSYRTRSLDEMKEALIHDYLDSRTGILNTRMADLGSPFADASVNLPLFHEDVGTAGRTHNYAVSELTAILEGMERYSSLAPRSKRTVVYGSYADLQEQALDPAKLGLHSKEQYARPNYPFKPFDPEQPMHWVWGYSLLQERPVLVPEQVGYYSMGANDRFAFESSNGCALGGSLEEAVFYGLLEVVERDSFLLTWYAKLPLPRLDLASARDRELDLMVDRLRTLAGFDVYFYNATMENGIPSVWGIAKNRKRTGLNLLCAAGSHPDPIRAVKGALHEMSGMVLNMDKKLESNKERIVRMLHDSSLLEQMEDHSLLYGLPEAEERLHFLLDESRPLRRFDEQFNRKAGNPDLKDDLIELLQTFRGLDMDVVVVDATAPEIARNGLHCVKVLIPGMLPMTFGHHFTRLAGLERVLRVPVELGYVKQPLTPDQLNPYPHPFP